jgi:hypothetical protein
MRDISAGEELTTDYALFDDYDGTMECRCGTPSCRRSVSGRDWQRPDLQRKYGSYFSSYLLRRLYRQPDHRRDLGESFPGQGLRACTRDDDHSA